MKKLVGFIGLAIGVTLAALTTSTPLYQNWVQIQAANDTVKLNTGWALIIASALGWLLAYGPTLIDRLGIFLSVTILGITAYLFAHLIVVMQEPTGRGVMFMLVLGSWTITMFRKEIFSEASPNRLIRD